MALSLAYALYAWVAPDAPAAHSYLVHADERTYIELETERHTDLGGFSFGGQDDAPIPTYYTTNVYYTQLGGWFDHRRRWLVFKYNNGAEEENLDSVKFRRSSEGGYVARVYISAVDYWYRPPQRFPADTAAWQRSRRGQP